MIDMSKMKRIFTKEKLAGPAAILIAAAFVVAGLLQGQDKAVLAKAIRICLECIGID